MARPNLPTVELSADYHERVRTEAHRRCGPGEDVRDVARRIVERSLAAVLGQLEAEEVGQHSRFCRCGSCPGAPPIAAGTRPDVEPVFADGTAPGTTTVAAMEVCRGDADYCQTHGWRTVHRWLGPVCRVSGRVPVPEGTPR